MTAMISQSTASSQEDIFYPSGDGEPVAETPEHLYALYITLEVLRLHFLGQKVVVLGNLFLYYAQNYPRLRVAPDVMVAFGIEPGDRDNFKTWVEGVSPAVIFEMTSASTRRKDEEAKYELYEGLGVSEYWQFDPKGEWINDQLRGYRLVDGSYEPITDGISQVLQMRLVPEAKLIGFYELATGDRLLIPQELRGRWLEASQRAEQEAQRAEEAVRRAETLAQRLRELGIDPDEI